MQVTLFSDFADAIAAKLAREIRAPALAAVQTTTVGANR
jgi:hypothetical protein